MLRDGFPIIYTADLGSAEAFYRETLGDGRQRVLRRSRRRFAEKDYLALLPVTAVTGAPDR